MGLDMHLHRKTYVKNWNHMRYEEKHQVTVKLNKKKHPYIKKELICNVDEEIGYWRKANFIHRWFVDNVQNGVDDCKEYYVDIEQLQELYDLCVQVKKSPEMAAETLPTQSGFFFGDTAYDEYYLEDLEKTIKILKPILKLDKELVVKSENGERVYDYPDYYYQSSW